MRMLAKLSTIAIALILITAVFIFVEQNNSSSKSKASVPQEDAEIRLSDSSEEAVQVVADTLDIPWEIAFLPDGDILVTERPGSLLRITQSEAGAGTERIEVDGVHHVGEGGLLGLALHPDYENNKYVYLYLTTKVSNGLTNRVERYELNGTTLENRKIILENIPGSVNHDGGRIAFGPDGYLYITTGDAQEPDLAQDTSSLAGKILRIADDGSIPSDNPFGNEVFSYGHRNPQGLAWDTSGRLWSTEHGRSGLRSGYDEINLIEKGVNYGWPVIQGDETREGMREPVAHSGADTTWAPAGVAFLNESLIFAGLRGSSLYQADLDGADIVRIRRYFEDEYGRLRVVRLAPDGYVYIATSNTDGRGIPKSGDDKIIRIRQDVVQ